MKNKLFIVLGLSILFPGLSLGADTSCKDESHYPPISKTELTNVVAKKAAFIVDVNSEESFTAGHVPGAVHFGSHAKDFIGLLPVKKDSLIVAYCGGPGCDSWKKAAQKACESGYTNIRHYKDGISGWLK